MTTAYGVCVPGLLVFVLARCSSATLPETSPANKNKNIEYRVGVEFK